ncbi:hypothetical protein GCM10022205_30030 [Spinactinospora alkalitolerans]
MTAAAGVLAVAAAVAALVVGPFPLPLWETVAALAVPQRAPDAARFIVAELRVPRLVSGAGAGVALGVAAALLQVAWRGPVADVRLWGMGGAAMLGAVAAGALASASTPPAAVAALVVVGAVAGAVGAGLVVWPLLRRRGRAGGGGFVVAAGVAVDVACTGAAVAVAVLSVPDAAMVDVSRVVVGATPAVSELAVPVGGAALVLGVAGVAVAWLLPRPAPDAARVVAWAVAGLLCGAAVAVAGPVALAGLAAAGGAWLLVGEHPGWVAAVAAPLGAAVVLACDVAGRVVAPPLEVSAGYLTGAAGLAVAVAVAAAGRRARVAA